MDYGNTGSSTMVHALEHMIEEGLKMKKVEQGQGDCELGLMLAFGPGIT